MSAVAGIWRCDGRPDVGDACRRMLNSLRMYGPDAQNSWDGGDVALGRNLTRLLPEDRFDQQPDTGGDDVKLVADLRLDNRDDLGSMLDIAPEKQRRMSDASFVLQAYLKWGEECFDRLIGDFAIAIWDGGRNKLLLARDYAGMRPLFYHRSPHFFAFASMPKGLHALPDVPYAANKDFVTEYLAILPINGSDYFYEGIESVAKGSFVRVTQNGVSIHKYWQPSQQLLELASHDEYAEALREKLDTAVQCRLRGASQIGAHLSAGLDSSAVAATAARLLAPTGGRVHAFTSVPREGYAKFGANGRLLDEGDLAASVADMYPNMDHQLIRTVGRSPLDGLDRNFFLYDQPVRNLCNQSWSDAINDDARRKRVDVMLTGSMGNFTTSYDGNELLAELVAGGQMIEWIKQAWLARRGGRTSSGILYHSFGHKLPKRLLGYLQRKRGKSDLTTLNYTLLNADRLRDRNLEELARGRGLELGSRKFQSGRVLREIGIRLGTGGVMGKGTLAGWHIDMRDPTADRRLFDFCLSVPTKQFCYQGVARALGRTALSDRLPKAVLNNTARGYQGADWHIGLSGDLDRLHDYADRICNNTSAAYSVDTQRLAELIENWPQGDWDSHQIKEAHRFALLRGVSTGDFLRRVSGGNS